MGQSCCSSSLRRKDIRLRRVRHRFIRLCVTAQCTRLLSVSAGHHHRPGSTVRRATLVLSNWYDRHVCRGIGYRPLDCLQLASQGQQSFPGFRSAVGIQDVGRGVSRLGYFITGLRRDGPLVGTSLSVCSRQSGPGLSARLAGAPSPAYPSCERSDIIRLQDCPYLGFRCRVLRTGFVNR